MAYNDFQPTQPDGASDNGAAFAADLLRNQKAMRDAVIALMFSGFAFSIDAGSGSTRRPQYMYWKNGSGGSAPWVRATITWGTSSGEKYNPTAITFAYSGDGGGSWDTIASPAYTFDANGDLTAITAGSTAAAIIIGLLGQFWRHVDTYTTHAASSSAHSMGTMATQNANAVAITDGTITSDLQRVTRTALGNQSGAFNIDCSAGHVFTLTVTGASAAATFTNKPSAGTVHPFSIKVVNGGLATSLFPGCTKPGGASLGLSSSGTDWVHGLIEDGSTVEITGTSKAMA